MTPHPLTPLSLDDASLWQHLVDRGLSRDEATRHVLIRRKATVDNLPDNIRKELDPGALASFGLGAADMMSFGIGDQVARALEPEAHITQDLAQELHPTAHLVGEGAGLLIPFAGEAGLAAMGAKAAPTALGRLLASIENPVGRAAARTVANAATGAAYAGAQAAGRTPGGVAPRLAAAKAAAPYGAAAGVAAPLLGSAVRVTGKKLLGGVVEDVAGPAIPRVAKPVRGTGPLADIAAAKADYAAGKISAQDLATALQMARAQTANLGLTPVAQVPGALAAALTSPTPSLAGVLFDRAIREAGTNPKPLYSMSADALRAMLSDPRLDKAGRANVQRILGKKG